MSGFAEAAAQFNAECETTEAKAADLLGGASLLGRVQAPFHAHDLVQKGIPAMALDHMLEELVILERGQLLDGALGMSIRTLQRYKEAPHKHLSREQSDRLWSFAEILARAIEIFGDREEAERWLASPSIGLEGRRPLELLATAAGTARVSILLTQIDYGVYT